MVDKVNGNAGIPVMPGCTNTNKADDRTSLAGDGKERRQGRVNPRFKTLLLKPDPDRVVPEWPNWQRKIRVLNQPAKTQTLMRIISRTRSVTSHQATIRLPRQIVAKDPQKRSAWYSI